VLLEASNNASNLKPSAFNIDIAVDVINANLKSTVEVFIEEFRASASTRRTSLRMWIRLRTPSFSSTTISSNRFSLRT